MPRPIFASLVLGTALAACSKPGANAAQEPAKSLPSIVGLYERAGIPDEPSRLCIAGEGGDLRFGLKSSWEGPENCMMKGRVRQAGPVLSLLIDGAPDCALSARVSATGLVLGESKGAECSYYCGPNTDLGEGAFTRIGSTASDIGKAVDLVGEPLC